MAKPGKGSKKGSISRELDNKVLNLIVDLLNEQSAAKQQTVSDVSGQETYDPYDNIALAKDLKYDEIVAYCRFKDKSFVRMKDEHMRASIERTWKVLKEEEIEEMKSLGIEARIGDEDESDAERLLIDENLMEVKDTNVMNKSVVNLWTLGETKPEQEPSESTEVPKADEDGKKSKKRSKESKSSGSKRIKPEKDRTPPSLTLKSLGGLDDVISQLMEIVGMPILHPEINISMGLQPPRGVLLHGPPGCGKTTIANALAGELQVPFISLSAPSVVSGMSGESEKKVREIFDEAKSIAPCLIFLDEIDAITPKRDGGAQREMERRIVSQLLTCMDELSLDKTDGKPVIVIGATNRPDSLDAALRRAGRFDREICVNVPSETARFHILASMMQGIKVSGEFDLVAIARMTPGYVGADLKSLVTAAGIAALKRIFGSLSQVEQILAQEDGMEIDGSNSVIPGEISTIQRFLTMHPSPLTPEQLEPLAIQQEDFLTALPTIQPTAKREGFATVPDVTWASVGALSNVRMELHMAIVQPIKHPKIYERVGITAPAGVLMWGPPGCGKTLLAKAVANESKANFISVKGPELLNKYVGESERAVRQVFTRARASVPCVIFFDELDALVPRRDASLSESSSRVVNTLLTELDGLNDRNGVFVIGATNRPDMIDPAMLRPGRLDKSLYIELPSPDERLEILTTLIRSNGTPVDPNFDLALVAHDERCRNFSGADLSSLVREAGVVALKKRFFRGVVPDEANIQDEDHSKIFVTGDDLLLALSNVKPSVSDKDRMKYERLNKRLGWSKTEDPNNSSVDQIGV
ncbi:unnamed protein product [Kuraishia capsulata CBS 1993]|uniref:AAA+ ATPase domain-containing protein n=1 Tax=Kuraishia capsulata CBS 1993 TaxID=1382522 RepID=W6MPG3_9ASCO|nr:uncharacterized protein KUCA_T00004504001 [Kuraishia capsulata CBS 1993]CDK28521.1 unnamed protein product [Kuraishia capsulata CBS 1993]